MVIDISVVINHIGDYRDSLGQSQPLQNPLRILAESEHASNYITRNKSELRTAWH